LKEPIAITWFCSAMAGFCSVRGVDPARSSLIAVISEASLLIVVTRELSEFSSCGGVLTIWDVVRVICPRCCD
jgi:hypothetical protein